MMKFIRELLAEFPLVKRKANQFYVVHIIVNIVITVLCAIISPFYGLSVLWTKYLGCGIFGCRSRFGDEPLNKHYRCDRCEKLYHMNEYEVNGSYGIVLRSEIPISSRGATRVG